MQLYGIIGYPLIHSRSPEYFNELFRREGMDARYQPFEMEDISALPHLLQTHPELCGLNVTIPHKQSILPYMDVLSDEAAAIGAVNCLRVERDNGKQRLYGYNTDATGFRRALLEFMPRPAGKALILGAKPSSSATGEQPVLSATSCMPWGWRQLPPPAVRKAKGASLTTKWLPACRHAP